MAVNKTGGDIDAYCNKCKLALAHVILAMDGVRVVRVECKTCRAVHAFKKDPASVVAKSSTPRKAASPRASRAGAARNTIGPADYDRILKGHDISRAQRYRATVHYAEGDVVDHVVFGLGMVTRILGDGKIEVLFPAGIKILVHARGEVA